MSGSSKVILIEENKAPQALISYTGAENEFFFSDDYLQGNIKKALTNFVKASKKYHKNSYSKNQPLNFAPYHYGLNTINFKTRKIYTMNGYDIVGLKTLPFFLAIHKYKLKALIEENKALIYFKKENQRYSLVDFLGTSDSEKAFNLLSQHEIDKNVIKERQNSGGFIKNYAKVLFTNLNECFILPHNFDFDVKEFSEENADEYFITLLEEGIKFSEEEVAQWYEYLEKHNAKQSIKKIESYFILKEKNHLEKNLSQCKENKSNKTKLKV